MMHIVTAKTEPGTPGGGENTASRAGRGFAPLPQGDGAEEALAQRAQSGDAGAFDALVTLLGGRVFAVAFRILGDRAEAEDIAQEVFVALYHHLPEFRGESRLSTWVYKITRNRCLNRLKFLKRRHVGSHADIDDPTVARIVADPDTGARQSRDPSKKLQTAELSSLLEGHLRALPEEQRTLVILRDLEDLSYDEIAEITGLPLGTVKSRLHRARAELAARLGAQLQGFEELAP
jgi:RNA polymerase sigma-70 factor (ECF subfamily)